MDKRRLQRSVAPYLGRVAGLAAAYFLTGKIGLALPYMGSYVTLIWPPAGLAIAALFLWGPRCWPGVWLGALLVNATLGGPVWLAAGIACGNTLGPLLAAVLLRRLAGFHPVFDRPRDVFGFVLLGAFGAMVVTATNGALDLCLAGVHPWASFGRAWLGWWLGNAMGVLVFAPPLLTLSVFPAAQLRQPRQLAEGLAVAAALLVASLVVFTHNITQQLPLSFLPFSLLIWAALRFGAWGASWAALLLSIAAIWGTAAGSGPFVQPDMQTGLVLLWAFIGTAQVVALLIASLQAEAQTQIAQRQRQQLQDLALQQVREEVWRMKTSAEITQVLLALRAALWAAQIPFRAYGVNAVDTEKTPPFLHMHQVTAEGQEIITGYSDWRHTPLWQIWRAGVPVYRRDLEREDPYGERGGIIPFSGPVRSVIDIPFSHGTLGVNSLLPDAFSAPGIAFLQELAKVLSEGFQRLEDLRRLERRARESASLAEAIAAVAGTGGLEEVLQVVVQEAARLMSAHRATLFLWEEGERVLAPQAQVGPGPLGRPGPGEGLVGQVFTTGVAALVPPAVDIVTHPLSPAAEAILGKEEKQDLGEGAAVPLELGGRVIGVLSVAAQQRFFDQRDLEVLGTLSKQVALAIERARRAAELEQEISERQQAEEALRRAHAELERRVAERTAALRESEEHLREAQVIAQVGSFQWDLATDTITWSDQLYRIYGVDPQQANLTYQTYLEYLHPGDRDKVVRTIEHAFQVGGSFEHEYRIIRQTGEMRWVLARGLVKAGGVVLEGTCQDISERKGAEEAQQRGLVVERVHRTILEMERVEDFAKVLELIAGELRHLGIGFAGLGINFIDEAQGRLTALNINPDGRITQVINSLDHPANQALLRHWRRNETWERAPDAELRDVLEKTAGVASSYRPEVVIDVPFSRGTLVMGLASAAERSPYLVQFLQTLSSLLTLGYQRSADLAARQQAEEELRAAKVVAEAANRAKDRFLAGISHELRTPLNAIIGFSGLLQMKLSGLIAPDQEQELRTIQTSAQHLLSLINDLLDLARIESGKIEMRFEPVDCRQVVEEVVASLRPLAQSKGLRFEAEITPHEHWIHTDRRAFFQILLNLASNAIKFTEQGRVLLELGWGQEQGRTLTAIRVADTGIGIAAEDQARLFQAFEQVGGSRARRREGTGLGLHLSKRLAELINGRIEFESEYGKGSTFTLLVPEGCMGIPDFQTTSREREG